MTTQLAIEPEVRCETTTTVPAVPVVQGGIVSRRGLFERLGRAGRVTMVSAPAGSGKTMLLRSWVAAGGLAEDTAWVSVQGDGERDPQQFWVAVADALRGTAAAAELVRPLTAAPDLDGWGVVERLLEDLGSLRERVWLVIDDLHELECGQTLAQLALLVLRAPARLRLVLATRSDPRLGLHRLRLDGELTELHAPDLRFTVEEARALFGAAGVQLRDEVLSMLVDRTEGWAAGLRLAALSLSHSPDPERFAAEFCGSERTVAEYLLAEVLERQSEPVRRLLLRTSVLERINGELADLLTGDLGGERVLLELEAAGAFVVGLDARRSWFRYHRLFADLLQLELRTSEPALIPALHSAAAGWFAGRAYPVDAVRHAQAAHDWDLATRVLSDHWLGLLLDGRGGTAREFLARFPAELAADPELAALRAHNELDRGSLEQAERYLALADQGSASVPAERRGRFEEMLAVLRLRVARQGCDLPAAMEEAQCLLGLAEAAGPSGMELRALALTSLGITELWAARLEDAQAHLEQGAALARRIGQPYLETDGLAHLALVTHFRSSPGSEQQARQALELARRHGWTDEPAVAVAYLVLASALFWQGRLEEAEQLLKRSEHTLRPEVEPTAAALSHLVRGGIELALGRDAAALAAYQRAMPLADLAATTYPLVARMRARMLQTLVRLGDTARADAILTGLDACERDTPEMRIVLAALRLAQGNPQAATGALAPVLSGSAVVTDSLGSPAHVSPVEAIAGGLGDATAAQVWLIEAWLVEAIARDALGDTAAAGEALEHALGLAAPGDVLVPFLFHPAPELLKRHVRHRTAHAALISRMFSLLFQGPAPEDPAGLGRSEQTASLSVPDGTSPWGVIQPLSDSEIRVLRYLPSDLSVPEIACELSLSANTIRTHMRHIYEKLQAHRRRDVVDRARDLGLLAWP